MRRDLLGLLCGLVLVGWWLSPIGPHRAHAAEAAGGAHVACPMPPSVAAFNAPLQSPVPAGLAPFRLQPATLRPLAGFSVDARVLSREDYRSGREADLSPTDLALGWGRMRDDSVLARLDVSQGGRWYRYRWSDAPPIPPDEIVRSSANMHVIPANEGVARALDRIKKGDRVRMDGWLVEADAPDGWTWRSSLTRDDSGDGACEVVYACSLEAY
ncbi:hypothetical protein [Cognatilysobacter lacus]|uniref:Uncharacterized protein n=1 Tax=Cognatilysobacter lacus TaxID=1643323 RepID=A0A5D8Z7Y2_9GAMM|nr:hypothetical protein [Lysobacter lacus]TZF90740.1 hypothetical protein FW784_04080 [Lysobacter lacus]